MKSIASSTASASSSSLSLVSTGAQSQFFLAILLISIMPLVVLAYAATSSVHGGELNQTQQLLLGVVVVSLVLLGYTLLAKYPMAVINLRKYLEGLAEGELPAEVEIDSSENNLQAIEVYMRTIIRQTRTRIQTIEQQSDALLAAERERVMLESIGAACHHLGQPATVLVSYLDMMERGCVPVDNLGGVLGECKVAASEISEVLQRLQHVAAYDTEVYLVDASDEAGRPKDSRILKI